jgi:hypothetical protein
MATHPLYSPYIALSDFYLFGHVKVLLRGKSFETGKVLLSATQGILEYLQKVTLSRVTQNDRSNTLSLGIKLSMRIFTRNSENAYMFDAECGFVNVSLLARSSILGLIRPARDLFRQPLGKSDAHDQLSRKNSPCQIRKVSSETMWQSV